MKMEDQKSKLAIVPISKEKNKAPEHHEDGLSLKPIKKKRGPMQMIKVALYMLRRKSSRKSKSMQTDVASVGKLLVGSMRPMHLQNNESPPPPAIEAKNLVCKPGSQRVEPEPVFSPLSERTEEVFTPPLSPAVSESAARASMGARSTVSTPSSSSSTGDMSRYASTASLQELLEPSDESSSDESDSGGDTGDDMIDSKAEEFIAQFYQKMRIEDMDYRNRRRHACEVPEVNFLI